MNKGRPALLLLSASLIPVIILAAGMSWYFVTLQREALDENARVMASAIAATLQRELDTQIQLLTVVADSPRFDLPISRSSFAETARRLRERIPKWEQIRISDESGNVVLAYPPLDSSANRRVVDIESHERLIQSRTAVVGNIVSGSKGRPAFAIRVPIERKNNLRAVVSAVIRPATVADLLRTAGLPGTWSAWVMDGQGRLVASTAEPKLAGTEGRAFAIVSASDPDRVSLAGGGDVRVGEASLQATLWRVKVGLPVLEYDQLARRAWILAFAGSSVALVLTGTAAFLFQREINARNLERESVANWQRMDALGKLTGQAAHDFNNLLMVFHSGVEGIRRRRDNEQRVTQLLAHMSEGITKGKAITQRLLAFSRRSNQGATHVELDLKLPELEPLLRQALNDAVVLDLAIPTDTWPVYVDPAALEIALVNLLTNAREAMENGGLVTVSARNVPEGAWEDSSISGAFVALTVTDTGRGVSQADLGRVFEPFFSTKENGRVGLGLTQVHSFAKATGGAVKVNSIFGRGTALTLMLPKSTEPRIVRETINTEFGFSGKILIVDDTLSSLESAAIALEGTVSGIFKAESAKQALAILEKHNDIEAVLSDIMMPGISGIELAEEIRGKYPRMLVVLMTGYSDRIEAGAAINYPVVTKPFRLEELTAALQSGRSRTYDHSNVVRLDGLPGI